DEVIIPVQCEYFALEGLSHLSHTIELVQRNLNPRLVIRGVVLTMFDGRTNLSREVEAEVRSHFPNTFAAVIPRSIRLAEAPSHGEPINVFDPTSSGARAYNDLADELIAALRARDLLPQPPVVVPSTPTAVAPIVSTPHEVATIPATPHDVATIPVTPHEVATIPVTSHEVAAYETTPRDLAPLDLTPERIGHTEQTHGA
ncbi:MAG: AAA family ATPase, partial [Chloroflexota bacterium]